METLPRLHLEAYEGPLDLLLDLIRKQEINIFDIPIARITQQYLEFLRRMHEMNMEIAGDFILMAATLIQIKSKMLLPVDPTAPAEPEQEDPRADLVQRLLEHEKFKNAAQMLAQKQMLEDVSWSNPPVEAFAGEPGELVVNLWDLVKVFHEVLERPTEPPTMNLEREEVSIAQMTEALRRALSESDAPVSLTDLFGRYPTRRALIALFLALLELVRLEAVLVVQAELFGPIRLRKHRLFDTVFGRRATTKLDQQYH